jgi:hypothetical protein
MFPSRTTRILLAAVLALGALLAVPTRRNTGQEDLPSLAAVNLEDVTRIVLTRAGQPTVMEKEEDRWFLRQPLQAAADTASIRSLIRGFTKPVPMDLRVDEGNLEDYQLDDSNNVTVELFTDGTEPTVAFVMGKDLAGGSSLLRLRDAEAVYRARVGGRHRFDREATDWRDRTLLDLDSGRVVGLSLIAGGHDLTFTRDLQPGEGDAEPTASPWRLADDPAFPVDQPTVTAVVQAIARLRASELHAPDYGSGWDEPLVRCVLTLDDGTVASLSMVAAPDGEAALARVQGRDDVFRVARTWLERFAWPAAEFRDKAVFSFARDQVDSIALEEGGHHVRIQQDLGTHLWRVVEPVAMEAELRKTLATVNALSELRAERVSQGNEPVAAGLVPPHSRFTIGFIDGSTHVLEVSAPFQTEDGQKLVYAQADEQLPIYELSFDTLTRLRGAFLKN